MNVHLEIAAMRNARIGTKFIVGTDMSATFTVVDIVQWSAATPVQVVGRAVNGAVGYYPLPDITWHA